MKLLLSTEAQTEACGARLQRCTGDKSIVFLRGNLGAGKTTFVRGFLRAAGHQGAVKSPTFTLVEEYSIGAKTIYHFDLYRLSDPEELEWIGIRDYFVRQAVSFIEWPDLGSGFLPDPDFIIELKVVPEGREIELIKMPEGMGF